MTVALVDEIWTDPSDGYTIRVVRFPYNVVPEGGGLLMGFSFHTGELWCEIPGQDDRDGRPKEVHIGPLVRTHTEFPAALLERGFGPDSHYLLGRRRGGFPLRAGSRPAVEALLAELKAEWRKHRRASNPEYRIEGLRAIRRARAANDSARLAALKKRYPDAVAYLRRERLTKARHMASSVAGSLRSAPKKSSSAAREAAGKLATESRKAVNRATSGSKKAVTKAAVGSRKAVDKVTTGSRTVADKGTTGARKVVGMVVAGSGKAIESAIPLANGLLGTTQGTLASALSTDLNALVQNMVKGPATIYDKAMDARYLETYRGGANHRMFDGGHTIIGAFRAIRDASPDDTVIQEAMGFVESMFRDMSTPKGLPLVNWDTATYNQVAEFLKSNFGIPKEYFYDLNSYRTTELIGGVIGVVATALCWNRADTEEFAKLVGGMGVSAVMGANPFLLVVTVVALARAFHKAHRAGEYAEFVDGHIKGGITSVASLAAVAQVGVVGGPAGLALLVGLSAGVLVNKATEKVRVRQIGQYAAERAKIAATETRNLADHCI